MTVTVPPPGRLRIGLAALTTLRRRPRAPLTLPAVRLRRPPVVVDAAAVARYARVCGFAPAAAVPPTYPHMLAFPMHMALMMRGDFPFPMTGLVHIANRIDQHAAIVPGDRLTVEAWCGSLFAHARGQAFAIEVAIARDGVTVWTSSSTCLYRTRQAAAGAALPPPIKPPTGGVPVWRGTAPRSIGRDYARVSGDRNPIHLSRIGARLFGFPTPIAHGMWSLARSVAALLPDPAPQALAILASFRQPLPIGAGILLAARDGGFALTDGDGGRVHVAGRLDMPA